MSEAIMVKPAQLTLTLALLTGPADAADKLAYSCKGKVIYRPAIFVDDERALVIDLDKQTVTFGFVSLNVQIVTDTALMFGSSKVAGEGAGVAWPV
jgi:hypothetical protein